MEINKISSNNFRANNKILFEAKIRDNIGCVDGDFVDLNNNGDADYEVKKAGLFGGKLKFNFTEPFLVEPYSKIENFAKANETEIITQDNIKNVNIKDRWGIYENREYPLFRKAGEDNVRSISELVQKESPFTPDAKWAFDTKKQSFIIYEPKDNNE